MKDRFREQRVDGDSSTSVEDFVTDALSLSPARRLRTTCLVAALSLTGILSTSALADDGSGSVLSQTGSNDRSQTGSNGRSQTGSNDRSQTGSNGRSQTGS